MTKEYNPLICVPECLQDRLNVLAPFCEYDRVLEALARAGDFSASAGRALLWSSPSIRLRTLPEVNEMTGDWMGAGND